MPGGWLAMSAGSRMAWRTVVQLAELEGIRRGQWMPLGTGIVVRAQPLVGVWGRSGWVPLRTLAPTDK